MVDWIKSNPGLLLTDTTFRDAHQSLLATRMRTFDLIAPLPQYQASLGNLFSLETWGGATFDVAYRFLKEDPWARLRKMRAAAPDMLFQMLLRGSNAVGYTNYPDNVVKYFVRQAINAADGGGVDLFRVFDSLNWVENMRVAMDAVIEEGGICEATICYTGDIFDPNRAKYSLQYYVDMAKELEAAGAHLLCIKDMAGICRPAAAKKLVETLRQEVGLPIHFHTHDTSGGALASILAAAEAGVDIADAAMGPMSGLTSQPNLGTVAVALSGTERDTGLDRRRWTRSLTIGMAHGSTMLPLKQKCAAAHRMCSITKCLAVSTRTSGSKPVLPVSTANGPRSLIAMLRSTKCLGTSSR